MTARIRAAAAVVALLLIASGALVATPSSARAATPDLTLVTAATYDVQPPRRRVAVTTQITATNHLHDSLTKRFFFQTAYLAVMPGVSALRISAPGLKPTVTVSARRATYTLLKLDFGEQLGAGKSVVLTLHFDIRDPGGAPERLLRISPSIVSFTAWAFASASTPGSSVSIRFPAGYNVTIGRGPLSGPSTDSTGRLVWRSAALASPLTFIADVSADRPGDYATRGLSTRVGTVTAQVTLLSWPDDTAWRDRVGDLVVRGLPALGSNIGLVWPIEQPLTVQEALVRNTGGYAGLFDPAANRIQVSYTASSGVVLHEAAHAWFNGRLVADRWAAEAFASYYADQAARVLRIKIKSPILTRALQANAFPLNAWGAIGTASPVAESYGYAASLAFARAVAARAGPAAMREIWARAAAGIGAYQPASGSELLGQAPDWRGLLDLVEDTTGQSFTDLWRRWIARPQDLPLLDARDAARASYAKAVADAGSWHLPKSIRDAMRAWQFDAAVQAISGAEAVLDQRRQLQAAAAAAGLTLPTTLETAFEGDRGIPAAAAEASAELGTIGTIRDAAATEPQGTGTPTLLVAIGLLGADPEARIADADAAFAAGHLDAAIEAASRATSAWTNAESTGRARIVSAGLLALALVLLVRTIVLRRRRPIDRPQREHAWRL